MWTPDWRDMKRRPAARGRNIASTRAISIFSHTLGVADFDGDGRLDITTGEMGQGGYHAAPPPRPPRLIIYRNDGQGHFTPHVISQEAGMRIHDGIVADIHGDGKPDVVGKNAIYRQLNPAHRINPTNVDWWESYNRTVVGLQGTHSR